MKIQPEITMKNIPIILALMLTVSTTQAQTLSSPVWGDVHTKAVVTVGTPIVSANFSVPVLAPGFMQEFYTVTNSTGTPGGAGPGLMRWDTNYIYLSTGTNLWRRVALTNY